MGTAFKKSSLPSPLSESSMFVAKRRFIIKTCGTTTLLKCVKPFLYLVEQFTNFDEVEDIFYSRKNFMRPELQKMPHTNFEEETKVLSELFPRGAAYCIGRINQDCWYLFTTNSLDHTKEIRKQDADQTFEIIMTDLDPEVMKIFFKDTCLSAEEATKRSGIDKLLPNVYIDDYLFDPCGYSMNGIMKNGCYMTIHITPESNCSYVSFETNCHMSSYKDLVERVVKTFRPGKFLMTVFSNMDSVLNNTRKEMKSPAGFSTYRREDMQVCNFKTYTLIYALFTKFPS